MNNHFMKSKWLYAFLLAPVISAVLALLHFGFVFKSGTAGFGIVILLILYFDRLKQAKDVLLVMAAFMFSIVGDWFLSNMNGDAGMFIFGIVFFFFCPYRIFPVCFDERKNKKDIYPHSSCRVFVVFCDEIISQHRQLSTHVVGIDLPGYFLSFPGSGGGTPG